jgi:hypothetical protein
VDYVLDLSGLVLALYVQTPNVVQRDVRYRVSSDAGPTPMIRRTESSVERRDAYIKKVQ